MHRMTKQKPINHQINQKVGETLIKKLRPPRFMT